MIASFEKFGVGEKSTMKKNTIWSVVLFSAKHMAILNILTALFTLQPIDILLFFINRQNSISGQGEFLPLSWLCSLFGVIGITFSVPILIGGVNIVIGIGLFRAKNTKKLIGTIFGGIIGLFVFLLGTNWLLFLTGTPELSNWIFSLIMMIWGFGIFAWLGNRIEIYYSGGNDQ